MTNLTKPVRRVSSGYVYYRGKARAVVIGIEMPQIITLRLKGCKQTYRLTAADLYWMAAKAEVAKAKREKRKRKR